MAAEDGAGDDYASPAQHARADARPSHRPGLVAIVVALVVAAAAAAGGFAVVSHRHPSYYAESATLLDEPVAIAVSQDAGIVDKLSRLRSKYAGIAHSDAVIDPAATTLGLPPATVAGSLVTRADADSLLLFIGARAGSTGEAERMANVLAQQLRTYVDQEQSDARIAARDRVSLNTVAPARGALRLSPTNRQRDTAAVGAGVAGFVIALGIADVLRRRRR